MRRNEQLRRMTFFMFFFFFFGFCFRAQESTRTEKPLPQRRESSERRKASDPSPLAATPVGRADNVLQALLEQADPRTGERFDTRQSSNGSEGL